MYLVLSDGINSAVSLYSVHENGIPTGVPDLHGAQQSVWTPWRIPFQDLVDANGVDLKHIDKICIGFGRRDNTTTPGGSGTVYFDDIRLYPSRCMAKPLYDLNGDCVVDINDMAILAEEWANSGMWPQL